jgi:restriction system protein
MPIGMKSRANFSVLPKVLARYRFKTCGEDRLGLDRVYVQAKRFSEGTIGRPQVQGFVGSLVGRAATKGVFVTTSTFSQQAIEYAKNLPQRVILIDGQRLTDLMIEHDVGLRVIRAIQFKRIDEDYFAEDD